MSERQTDKKLLIPLRLALGVAALYGASLTPPAQFAEHAIAQEHSYIANHPDLAKAGEIELVNGDQVQAGDMPSGPFESSSAVQRTQK